ncbi:MAG: glycoside hydrolase family 16 protein [Balneolaceae bacterium]|nr:glycoside hydrolase family 16 protein [Balneolaceae bacterium]
MLKNDFITAFFNAHKNIGLIAIFAISFYGITSCISDSNTDITDEEPIEEGPNEIDHPWHDAFETQLGTHDSSMFHMANGWSNGDPFYNVWRASQVMFDSEHGGQMTLTLDFDDEGPNYDHKSGEYRSNENYGYGRFEVRMRAARGDGLVSSFFLYTGPSENNPWDEIDIEFLGKNTREMQINYYTNGVGGNEVMIDLGFDAADDFNNYAFEWLPDRINWFVNGELVHTETDESGTLPSHAMKIMVNLWPGIGVDEWLEPFDSSILPVEAVYEMIRFTPYPFED